MLLNGWGSKPARTDVPPQGGAGSKKREYAGIKWQNIQAMNNNCIKQDKNNVKHTEKRSIGYVFGLVGIGRWWTGKGRQTRKERIAVVLHMAACAFCNI